MLSRLHSPIHYNRTVYRYLINMAVLDWVFTSIIAVMGTAIVLFSAAVLYTVWIFLRVNDFPHRRRFCRSRAKLNGKTAIVTGGNSGTGYETAKDLAKRGARVILGCRNMERGNKAKQQIIDDTGNSNVLLIHLNLSDLDSVRKFANDVMKTETRLHLLVNNAGIGFDKANPTTKQGFDAVFGTNHLGHFLLTFLLMDLLKAAAPSRIVNVASMAYLGAKSMDFTKEDVDGNLYPKLEGYNISKLANILHVKELATKYKETGVTAYSSHPGIVQTNIFTGMEDVAPMIYAFVMNAALRTIGMDCWTGAQCTLYCALEESLETVSGHYYENCKQVIPQNKLVNDKLAMQLWDESLKMVGIVSS